LFGEKFEGYGFEKVQNGQIQVRFCGEGSCFREAGLLCSSFKCNVTFGEDFKNRAYLLIFIAIQNALLIRGRVDLGCYRSLYFIDLSE
jgi:hypothetical protein